MVDPFKRNLPYDGGNKLYSNDKEIKTASPFINDISNGFPIYFETALNIQDMDNDLVELQVEAHMGSDGKLSIISIINEEEGTDYTNYLNKDNMFQIRKEAFDIAQLIIDSKTKNAQSINLPKPINNNIEKTAPKNGIITNTKRERIKRQQLERQKDIEESAKALALDE